MHNIYTIYKAPAIDGVQQADWDIYFKTVTYEEGIRFLQSMNRVMNVKFTMLKTSRHPHQLLRDAILDNHL